MSKYTPIGIVLLMMIGGCAVTQDQHTPVWQKHETDPATGRAFWYYVPSKYSPDTPIPVIVSCHGTPPYDVAEHHIREWKMLGEQYRCIIICPELIATDGLIGDGPIAGMLPDERYILSLISMLGYRFNIDRANIMITGFSGGGFPTYWVGLRHPEVFSAVVGRNCNFSKGNLHGWYPSEAKETPVYIYYGENDPGTIAAQSRAGIRYFRSEGFRKLETKVIPGRGHERQPGIAMDFFRRHWRRPRPSVQWAETGEFSP